MLPENYSTWFASTYPHHLKKDCITIAVPNDFYRKCLVENYQDLIETTLETISNSKIHVDFLVEPVNRGKPNGEEGEEKKGGSEKTVAEPGSPNSARGLREPGYGGSLNPKYTFDNFVVGSSNQFAHAAALAVGNHPAMAYNPLFIYGAVGLGKTHLLHAIGNRILENDHAARVKYISAESFTVDLIESLKRDDMQSFRKRYRPLDVLLVDDIQFIAGKERTQEEFFHTFNTLYESHKQVILSSDKYPKDIHNMEERLRSRFESGLIADINVPDLETKVAILYKKAEFHKKPIPQDVAIFIASNIKSNIRELEGLLLRIIAYASFTHREIDLPLAKEVLKEFTFDKTKNFTVPNILKTVADYYHVKVSDLKSKKRSRDISTPRQIAMYLCREYTKSSLPDIGRQFGGKDHTTVIFSHRKISSLVQNNNDLEKSIQEVVRRIEGG
ncbi:MAG: chromosomal replication initiator protein DnaA [Nitrospinaceae bacterium]|nr:chromosomal replication initiator protein DnaA [Nitrospinaceae bacterium]NIR54719.1 chromosomal replication initiator protein DnaA [Nitrospinaceae bacterium]NIS85139.1 chromosomal replication initiator protein DnaA [Nitrospinaceae bacterium]NIT81956.1 chromosomal replication initiator protein DnaA [Nitrospinaceae bacterium]NIU44218.1 chromosomal replication initiator protein DnaA [Nitrospinaceae bacterium]